ncbi:MAG TPA: DUF1501 domain-containing protein [Cyclobacteriaceae bacterium]|nr:DUF1501 domain-containing protein [Cyclobacteriaceae bacterium]
MSPFELQSLQAISRRHFLVESALGLGAAALGAMLGGCTTGSSKGIGAHDPMMPRAPHFPGKAKSVIYLHMAGAPSQLELFDFKPELQRLHNQLCPPSLLEGKKFAFIRGTPRMLGPQANFKQHGDSGAWISDYVPHLASIADELAFLKGVSTDQFNHGPAQLFVHTGSARLGRPSMGSWVTYGLGTENSNLPGFVVLTSGGKTPDAGKSVWGSGFLPSVYQGVQCRTQGEPVLYLNDPPGVDRELKRKLIDAVNAVNQEHFLESGDPETLTRMHQYELAYRMQIAVPEVMNINNEPPYIHQLYGTEPGKSSFANNCLLARKLVEQGVRFVQLYDWGWDSHGTDESLAIDYGLRNKCREIDRATTALILDLKQRGLLDETLVVWGGEFGRTPMQENRENKTNPFLGRDHHVEAFTLFMAGGGVRPGVTYGETDEIGYYPVQGKVSVHDVQATILNQLGLNHEQLTYEFQGRQFRLTDVSGKIINQIIS